MTRFQPNFRQTQRICELVERHGNADNIGPDDWEEIATEIGFERMWGQGIKEFYRNYIYQQRQGFTPKKKQNGIKSSSVNSAKKKHDSKINSQNEDIDRKSGIDANTNDDFNFQTQAPNGFSDTDEDSTDSESDDAEELSKSALSDQNKKAQPSKSNSPKIKNNENMNVEKEKENENDKTKKNITKSPKKTCNDQSIKTQDPGNQRNKENRSVNFSELESNSNEKAAISILGAKRPKYDGKGTNKEDIYWYVQKEKKQKVWVTNDWMKKHHIRTLLRYYENNLRWE